MDGNITLLEVGEEGAKGAWFVRMKICDYEHHLVNTQNILSINCGL